MSVTTADLKCYASASMPENDTDGSGGAIDANTIVEFTDLAANDTVQAVSDNAADTMNITVTGRNAGGAIVSETKALTGTTPISLSTLGTIERLLKIVLASAAAGVVTVRRTTGPTTIVAIPAGKTGVRRLFYDAASESGTTTRYEKVFWKNENGTFSLSNAAIKLTADPGTSIEVGCATAKDDSGSVANRKAAPGGVSFVDDSVSQAIPTGVLAAGETIGVWVKMTRGAAAAALKSTFTVELSGTST